VAIVTTQCGTRSSTCSGSTLGLFEQIEVRRYVWETLYTADSYIALLDTFSGHIAMDAPKRERLYREIRARIARREEPFVRRHWLAIGHLARRAR
jgi:hypothetical protein